ncbi:MAG: dienelactone hydrolase family protein [Pseudomonadota bacterium]|nr:dienelactone hydrolase family protein [Pseudomonadota bacterium]
MAGHSLNFYKYGNEEAPENLVILLHGYGSNGQDLITLAPEWGDDMPKTLFVSPDAPQQCEISAFGFQWFSLMDRREDVMLSNINPAAPILEKFIQDCSDNFKIPFEKIALVGFSQGTMMSLYTAPRMDKAIAGVLGFSGALLNGKALMDAPDKFLKFPIYLAHGSADEVVPVDMFDEAHAFLQGAGYDVQGHITPGLGHGIDLEGVQKGHDFLKRILYP